MTDYKCLSYWDGTQWQDCRDAAPVFAAGAYLNANVAKGTTGNYTLVNLTSPRTCSLTIAVTGTYLCAANANQDLWQRVLVDGVGGTGNQLGGYREQLRFTASAGVSGRPVRDQPAGGHRDHCRDAHHRPGGRRRHGRDRPDQRRRGQGDGLDLGHQRDQ